MSEIVCKRYTPALEAEWDRVVDESRNGTFLIKRQYLEYHSHRFIDHSLVFEQKGEIIALLPANQDADKFYSHQGLTYGGVVMSSHCKGLALLEIFNLTISYLKQHKFKEFIYKSIPHIYHKKPAEEEIYALYRHKAQVESVGISSTIDLSAEVNFNSLRQRGIKRATQNNVQVSHENDFAPFWKVLEQNLELRHSVKPVHSLPEIELLKKRFPDNIKLYTANKDGNILAGVVIYETSTCAHCQYIASTQEGRNLAALDKIFSYLIKEQYKNVKYFDFGISTEQKGEVLNEGLLTQKEGFGATATIYITYKITL